MSSAITTAGQRVRHGAPAAASDARPAAFVPAQAPGSVDPDLSALLRDGARLAREGLGADFASVLLRDSADRLVAVATASPADDLLGSGRFGSLPPIPLAVIPRGLSGDPAPRPILVNDADSSGLLPDEWRTAFAVKSAAVSPLVLDGVVRGALVAGYRGVPHEFSDAEVRLLEAAAGSLRYLLGVVDATETTRRRATLLDRVGAAGRDLCAARTRHAVLQAGMESVAGVLGGSACSVHVVLADGVETLASRGPRQPDPGLRRTAELDGVTRAAVRALAAEPARPVVLDDGRHVAVPMTEPDSAARAVLVVTAGRAPAPLDLDAAHTLAAQTWLAYERATETAWLAGRAALHEALCALAADPVPEPDLQRLLERLAPAVRDATGAEVLDAFLLDGAAARRFATPSPDRRLAGLLRRWRRAPAWEPEPLDDLLVVPVAHDGALLGALRVRPGAPGPDAVRLLGTVAAAVAGTVARVLCRAALADQERVLAVATERERIGSDLHDGLGQQLFALRVELDGLAATAGDRTAAARLREAVDVVTRASADLRLAVHAMSFLEYTKRGLVPSLRTLVRKLGETTQIGLHVRVVGTPVRLDDGCEEALFRVAHEALANVVRHSRASTATVTVSYSPERVSLIVRDDGTGMSARSDEQRGLHFGVRAMQRRMTEIGGGLEVSNFRPHGVCLHAWVPVR